MTRRRALQVTDLGGFIVVLGFAVVYASGAVAPAAVYVTVTLLGACAAFQFPAISAAVPRLVPQHQIQRANGLVSSAKSSAEVLGPALGGVLIALAGLGAILTVVLVGFAAALTAVQLTRFVDDHAPEVPRGRRRLLNESLDGIRDIASSPSLRGLIGVFFVVNLVMVSGFAVLPPMVLARTGADAAALAAVNVCLGLGGITGGLALATWGGPRDRVRGMLLGVVGMCVFALMLMSLPTGVVGWCVAILVGAALMPLVNSSVQSIVQTKVPSERQGRVFGAVLFVSQVSVPLAMIVAGPLADGVFEPDARDGAGIPGLLSPVVGTGPGSGMAAMLLLAGLLGVVVTIAGMTRRPVRDLDLLLPDRVADPESPARKG